MNRPTVPAFGCIALPWNPGFSDPADQIVACADDCGQHLADQLARAREFTADWANEPLADALVEAALAEALNRLAATGVWGEANRVPSAAFWRAAAQWLEQGSLQRHARFKPHGYAGDWEMMTRIWHGALGGGPLERVLDRYFLRQAAPQAVRSRMEHVARWLVAERLARAGRPFHVVSVGCGPALDVAEGIRLVPTAERHGVRVTLLDLDPHGLDAASRNLAPLLPAGQFVCLRTNLNRLAKPGRPGASALFPPADLIVCTGLFDYLADAPARLLIRELAACLTPGGRLAVGNFAVHNPTRALMEWVGNWYLLYRTPDDLHSLARGAELPSDQYCVMSERLGVNLFLVVTLP